MTDWDRIQRLENVLGTMIRWLYYPALTWQQTEDLLKMLQEDDIHTLNQAQSEPERREQHEPPCY